MTLLSLSVYKNYQNQNLNKLFMKVKMRGTMLSDTIVLLIKILSYYSLNEEQNVTFATVIHSYL